MWLKRKLYSQIYTGIRTASLALAHSLAVKWLKLRKHDLICIEHNNMNEKNWAILRVINYIW